MKKVLFFGLSLLFFFSCGLNVPETSNISLSVPYDIVSSSYRAVESEVSEETVPESFELICRIEGNHISPVQKKVEVKKNESAEIVFENVPFGKKVDVIAKIEIKKWVDVEGEQKFLDRYEDRDSLLIKKGENNVSLKLRKVYTDKEEGFGVITNNDFVTFYIGEIGENNVVTSGSMIEIPSAENPSAESTIKIKLAEQLKGKNCIIYVGGKKYDSFNDTIEINLIKDNNILINEGTNGKSIIFVLQMESLPLKNSFKFVINEN